MRIKTREERVQLCNGREQLNLLHISDVHVWFSSNILNELKGLIFKAKPDLVVMTGDYYDTPKGAHLFKAFLSEVARSFTVVFIGGNHDFLWGKKVFDLLLHIPNCFYVGEELYSFVSPRGYKYNVGGWKHRPLLESKSYEKNIVLIHNPAELNIGELGGLDLVLAGHLHGGQFIFFTYKNYHYPGTLFYRYCTDRTQINDTTLIVSKGVGDTFPFRFNCPREVVQVIIE